MLRCMIMKSFQMYLTFTGLNIKYLIRINPKRRNVSNLIVPQLHWVESICDSEHSAPIEKLIN